ncbi:hypothetical protein Dimus_033886, partial [Dionaea muscipula]
MELQEKGSSNEMGRMDGASIWPDLQAEVVDIGDTSHQKYLECDLSDDSVEIDEDLFNKMMQEGERLRKEGMELALNSKKIPDCSEPEANIFFDHYSLFQKEWLSYTRLVEVDLSKTLIKQIEVKLPWNINHVQIIEYENLPAYCSS